MRSCKGCVAKDQEIEFLRSLVTEAINKPRVSPVDNKLSDAYWVDMDGIHHKVKVAELHEDSTE